MSLLILGAASTPSLRNISRAYMNRMRPDVKVPAALAGKQCTWIERWNRPRRHRAFTWVEYIACHAQACTSPFYCLARVLNAIFLLFFLFRLSSLCSSYNVQNWTPFSKMSLRRRRLYNNLEEKNWTRAAKYALWLRKVHVVWRERKLGVSGYRRSTQKFQSECARRIRKKNKK